MIWLTLLMLIADTTQPGSITRILPDSSLTVQKQVATAPPAASPAAVIQNMENAISVPNWLVALSVIVMIAGIVPTVVSVLVAWQTVVARKAYEEGRKQIEVDVAAAKGKLDRIDGSVAAIRLSAGAFFPAGHFLSKKIDECLAPADVANCPCGTAMMQFKKALSLAVIANAEYGQMIQDLFTADGGKIAAAAGYLTQYPSVHTRRVLDMRLEFEKKSTTPNVDAVGTLALAVNEVNESLKRMSVESSSDAASAQLGYEPPATEQE
jgi:hypothetical protein